MRRAPKTGGGGPEIVAGVAGPGRAVLSVDEHARARGREVQELVVEAVRGVPDERAIRDLIRLAHEFPGITQRTPEFGDVMNYLLRHQHDDVVGRIVGGQRRGRRTESHFYLVALVDRFLDEGSPSIRAAAVKVKEQFGAHLAKDASSIQNDYSRYKHLYDLFRASKFVPGNELASEPWRL